MKKMLEELMRYSKDAALIRRMTPLSKQAEFKPITGYDNSTALVGDGAVVAMLDNAYEINLDATYKNDASGEEFATRGGGTGFVGWSTDDLELLVTCEHVMTGMPETIRDYTTGETYTLQEVRPSIIVDGAKNPIETLRLNEMTDIAIVKPTKKLRLRKTVAMANKDLVVGDAIYAVGFPSLIGKFLSQGIITNLGKDNDYFFYESAPLNPGNSGGPLYVVQRGVPYVAGVGEFYFRGTQGMFGAIHHRHAETELYQVVQDFLDNREDSSASIPDIHVREPLRDAGTELPNIVPLPPTDEIIPEMS